MDIQIRHENADDYRVVEELTREAFWNLYVEGCNEHYLVHIMRNHQDFIGDLAFVAIIDDKIVGNIMYTKSYLADASGNRIDTITFGPIGVLPSYQRRGIGSAMIRHSIDVAIKKNHKAIIILGDPHNYCKHGFKASKDCNVSDAEGRHPYGLLVLELEKDLLRNSKYKCFMSDVFTIDNNAAEEFDKQFPFKRKEYRHTQYEFSMACRAYIE